jgi:hypothetical protein
MVVAVGPAVLARADLGAHEFSRLLGLRNYPDKGVERTFREKSNALFVMEWTEKGHVQENYNAVTGTGRDVTSSDRLYHRGALLGYAEFVERIGESH